MNKIRTTSQPAGNRQKWDMDAARDRLYRKLVSLDLKELGISDYNRRYLGEKIGQGTAFLKLYGTLLDLSIQSAGHEQQVSPGEFVLTDYGGGNGLISLLAKEAGIGTVIYNDIYDVSCEDVKRLSEELDLQPDHVVCGDADDLVEYVNSCGIRIDTLVSFDVLEHIYDVKSHFETLTGLAERPFRVVYATGANGYNPFYVRWVRKKQMEAEYRDREKKAGHKERDTVKAYLRIRNEMIAAYAPHLPPDEVEVLARATRGLRKGDIEHVVDEYLKEGRISYRPDHPTNTCDPYTGNWCEHLLDHGWLERVLSDAGYEVEIIPGTNEFGSRPKRYLKFFLNRVIRFFGRRAMFLAPHYIVYADLNQT